MKPSELPGTRRLYRLTNRALAQIRELRQYDRYVPRGIQ